jgi:hypothetical protein
MLMETTKTLGAVSTEQEVACPMCHGSGSPTQSWLANRRGWVVLGSAAIAGAGARRRVGDRTIFLILPA